MMAILVLYTKLKKPINNVDWGTLLSQLPEDRKDYIYRKYSWRDRHHALYGDLLLHSGMLDFGLDKNCLINVVYANDRKPYSQDKIFFNKSHSGCYVICALSAEGDLGIDIEEIKAVDLQPYKIIFHPMVWQKIIEAEDKYEIFYEAWTRIESILKADGRGMQLTTNNIMILNGYADLDGKRWHLTRLEIDPDYSCCLATLTQNPSVELIRKDFI